MPKECGKEMIVTIDIGNTNISCACFRKKKIVSFSRTAHAQWKSCGLPGLEALKSDIEKVIIASVVPTYTRRLKRELSRRLKVPVFVLHDDIGVRLPHTRLQLSSIGADRCAALYGSLFLFKAPLLIVDCGTAITFDVIDEEEVYQGGLIVPGMSLSFDALKKRGALLPKDLGLVRPRSFPAKNTQQALLAGSVYGFSALVDGLIERFEKSYGNSLRTILTGGGAELIRPYVRHAVFYEPCLIHKSLFIIAGFLNP